MIPRPACSILILGFFSIAASAGEISDYYFKFAKQNPTAPVSPVLPMQKARSYQEVTSTNDGIAEIGIERTSCYGSCPVYTFVARSDGTFHYKGDKFVPRTGEFTGIIPLWQFHALAQFINDSGYMSLQTEYRAPATDLPTTFTMVVKDGQRKVISNYGDTWPTVLWAIQQLIDDLMAEAVWKTGLPKPPEPVLPRTTRYDSDPVLRAVYLDSYRKGYSDGWERKYELPAFAPTSDADKARVLAYTAGLDAGRAALAKWFGTNSPPAESHRP